MLPSWITQLFSGSTQASRRRRAARRDSRTTLRPRLEILEDRYLLSGIYFVTSSADDGSAGTLRAAINAVNAGQDNTIEFAIGTSGSAQTISLLSALPTITANNVYVNGMTQEGGSIAPKITLDGTNAGSGSDGLRLDGANCTVSGLAIENVSGAGVEVVGANNVIGGILPGPGGSLIGPGDVLSANFDGVLIDSGASGTLVEGSEIGTNAAGTAAMANRFDGIDVYSSNDTIGGSFFGARNIISGNTSIGVYVVGSDVLVRGNHIGADAAGFAAVGNGGDGIDLETDNNTVVDNLISGNGNTGLFIRSTGNQVQGNLIGTNLLGNAAVANRSGGVQVIGNNNTIGGNAAGEGNLVSGNIDAGIDVSSTGVLVAGNTVGLNLAGNAVVANTLDGVDFIYGDVGNDTLGGTTLAARNVISGNGGTGVFLGGPNELAQGNYIGTNAAGTVALGNGGYGISSQSPNATIGGTVAGARNIVSGNGNDGILNYGVTAVGDLIEGNFVGTNATGTKALGNLGAYGIADVGGADNTIGGTSAADRNLISGNAGVGLDIQTASGDVVQGNYIGTDVNGTKAVGNGDGIDVYQSNFTLGGTTAGAGNLISGNTGYGAYLDPEGPIAVQGNFIGTNARGTASVANGLGIEDGAANTTVTGTIGGTTAAARNLISGNTGDGVLIADTYSVLVEGNFIGTDVSGTKSVGNGNGVDIGYTADNTTIGGTTAAAANVIAGNTNDGVLIGTGGESNFLQHNVVEGNRIGINVSGSALGNSGNGIEQVGGEYNTIGGSVAGARNVISNNGKDGILIGGGFFNVVSGNYVGTDLSGRVQMANDGNGVEVDGSYNTIGGTAAAAVNVISANKGDGVLIGTSKYNLLQGNLIGTDVTGRVAMGNGNNGIEDNGMDNTIGGSVAGARNVIAANAANGILGGSNSYFDVVQGDYVGTDATGDVGMANGSNGVAFLGGWVTIGGTASADQNIISGNGGDGILVGTRGLIEGNYVGLKLSGNALGNGGDGIELNAGYNTIGGSVAGAQNFIYYNANGIVSDSTSGSDVIEGNYVLSNVQAGTVLNSTYNTIGGTSAAARNIISGNGTDGIDIYTGADHNVVQFNFIGTDFSGNTALANGQNGIYIAGNYNTIGGMLGGGENNVISGNKNNGVLLQLNASGNLLEGDYVGTDVSGANALANGSDGVSDSGTHDIIGGTASGAGNLISGNTLDGITFDINSSYDEALGNYIGTDASGTQALGNGNHGVHDGGLDNTIGGVVAGSGNIISANGGEGVLCQQTSSGAQVLGNYIGTDVSGTKALGNYRGFELAGFNATIGGTSVQDRNIISGNHTGSLIDSGATGNAVQGNYIGTDVTGTVNLTNHAFGISVQGSNNTIGGSVIGSGNLIAHCLNAGVNIGGGSGNTIRLNSIFDTNPSAFGIAVQPNTNNNIVAPTISSAVQSGTALTVTGTYTAAIANVPYVLDFYANPTGDPEGKVYLGSLTITPTLAGINSFTSQTSTNVTVTYPLITATLTDSLGDTSMLSNGQGVAFV